MSGALLASFPHPPKDPLHLDLSMSGKDLALELKKQAQNFVHVDSKNQNLEKVIRLGERLYAWVDAINATRSADNILSLSSAASQGGYPIEAPIYNNAELVLASYEKLKSEDLPAWMQAVLFDGAEFLTELPIADKDFVVLGRKVDRVYGKASRWKLQRPWLWSYIQRRKNDIRGHYYLSREENLTDKLNNFSDLSDEKKAELSQWLGWLCYLKSGEGNESCATKLQSAQVSNSLNSFYLKYREIGKRKWESFFKIPSSAKRSDISWTEKSASIPFLKPNDTQIQSFMKDNVEDEWRWNDWQLSLDFKESGFSIPKVVFKPGVTPNVNGLGGNTITMDSNQSLTEYNTQWTIRHEFGHVLGFPDCYVEFYDDSEGVMVSYQLDVDNLMCSRRGKLQEKHFEEMHKNYADHQSLKH